TVLGELLPPAGRTPQPSLAPDWSDQSSTDRPDPPPTRPAAAQEAGPIRFDCPSCRTGYTVNRANAGKEMNCRACGQSMVIPGSPGPSRPSPACPPLPVANFFEDDYRPESDEPVYDPPPALQSYLQPRAATRAPNGPVNRIVASVGAGLVF